MRMSRIPAVAIVAAVSVVGGVLLGSAVVSTQDRASVRRQIYTEALSVIESEYVEPLDARCTNAAPCGVEAIVYDSIDGMLRTLDPHSSFFTPRDFRALRERQEGRYFGIGIQISPRVPDVVVSSVFEGSPANRAGIRRGDVIARVGAEEARNWTTQDVVDRVKGPKGTTVDVGIRRPNVDSVIPLTIPRDEIRIPSVRTSFMLDATTGYVRLQDFSETTNAELGEALGKLKGTGMQQLVLDLRDNGGGPLEQAILVASRFLNKGEKVVYTRGRMANADDDRNAPAGSGSYADVPLIVLVDRQSASASEIVSGAIQDHDRGLVVGETTFGKALVQTIFPVSGGAGLALTTGRYYTPSDRLIQRPWDGSFDEYLTYYYRDQNPKPTHAESQARKTAAGRTVYEGGGIEPDHFVVGAVEGFNPTRFSRLLASPGGAVEKFAQRFSRVGDDRPGAKAPAGSHKVSAGWKVTDALVEEFRAFLTSERVKIDEAAFAADLAFLKAMIHFEVDVDLWGIEEARRNLAAVDPQIRAGMGYFDESRQLLATRKSRL